jgi:hypothetical protein
MFIDENNCNLQNADEPTINSPIKRPSNSSSSQSLLILKHNNISVRGTAHAKTFMDELGISWAEFTIHPRYISLLGEIII